jgi:hypothetical protein
MPNKDENMRFKAFAAKISDTGVADVARFFLKMRETRTNDTSSNMSYSDDMQLKRLLYFAGLQVIRDMEFVRNAVPFTYSPIHFHGMRLGDTDKVIFNEYWREQCYTLYSYALHEYHRAIKVWNGQTKDCSGSTEEMASVTISSLFPNMSIAALNQAAANARCAQLAIIKCIAIYTKESDDDDTVIMALGQSGDMKHLESFRNYLAAFSHELILCALEYSVTDLMDISEDMEPRAKYAALIAKMYKRLNKAGSKWVPPDRQPGYSNAIELRMRTWERFAQILEARQNLCVISEHDKKKSGPSNPHARKMNTMLAKDASSLIHRPLAILRSELDSINTELAKKGTSVFSSHEDAALNAYFVTMATKMIDTYGIYERVYQTKSTAPFYRYDIDKSAYVFNRYSKKSFDGTIDIQYTTLVSSGGTLYLLLDAVEQRARVAKNDLESRNTSYMMYATNTSDDDLLGLSEERQKEDVEKRRNTNLGNPFSIRLRIENITGARMSLVAAYDTGVIEERLRWLHCLRDPANADLKVGELGSLVDEREYETLLQGYDTAVEVTEVND